jgi:hypothetical protein
MEQALKEVLGRPSLICGDNDKIVREEIGREGVDWIRVMSDKNKWRALVSTVITLLVPYIAGNFLINFSPVGFLRTLLNGVADLTL